MRSVQSSRYGGLILPRAGPGETTPIRHCGRARTSGLPAPASPCQARDESGMAERCLRDLEKGPRRLIDGAQRLASSRHAIASVNGGTLAGSPAIASNSWVSSAATSGKCSPSGTSCQIAFLSPRNSNYALMSWLSAVSGCVSGGGLHVQHSVSAVPHGGCSGRRPAGIIEIITRTDRLQPCRPGADTCQPPDRRCQQNRSHDCMPIRSMNAGTTPFLPRKSTLTSDSLIVTRRCLGVLYVESSIGWPLTKAC